MMRGASRDQASPLQFDKAALRCDHGNGRQGLLRLFFLYKTKKLSSRFSKTQFAKIKENSVFAQKLNSKCIKNWVFSEIFSKNQPKNLDFCPKPPKFSENSVPKTQKLSFSEISET